MPGDETGVGFRIWAVDDVVYGPVELPVLITWVKEERVTKDTWVFSEREAAWRKAPRVPELRMFFQPKHAAPAAGAAEPVSTQIKPGVLRRVKIFADLSDEQLQRFVDYMELQQVRPFAEIVKQGQHGDAMYLVLEGELRVRMMVNGKESVLVTLGPGEFFGEISLFDHGPRSADVVSNKESVLLKVSAESFEKLQGGAPELAAPFLFAIAKTLTSRIRADNKRHRDSVAWARSSQSG